MKRNAYLYIRQSTLRQVLENTESTQRQYALRQNAASLGWPLDRIIVIDTDLGQSGASAADRAGFQRLVTEVSLGPPASCSVWKSPGWRETRWTGIGSWKSARYRIR